MQELNRASDGQVGVSKTSNESSILSSPAIDTVVSVVVNTDTCGGYGSVTKMYAVTSSGKVYSTMLEEHGTPLLWVPEASVPMEAV